MTDTTPSSRSARFDDDRLRTVARWIARTSVEVERGLRPITHFRPLLNRHDPRPLRFVVRLGSDLGGPVTAADLGQPHLSRIGRDHVYASVATTGTDGRAQGLSMHLFRKDARWYLADVQRLVTQRQRESTVDPERPAWRGLEELSATRRVAVAARDAAAARLVEMDPARRDRQQLIDVTERFGRLADELGAEFQRLQSQLELRARHGLTAGRCR